MSKHRTTIDECAEALRKAGGFISAAAKQLGMKPEEVFRLSDFTMEDFLNMMVKDQTYSKAEYITKT